MGECAEVVLRVDAALQPAFASALGDARRSQLVTYSKIAPRDSGWVS